MKIQTATKLALKHIRRYVPTPNWTEHYPNLNELEQYKISAMCKTLLKETGNMVFAGPFSSMRLAANLELASDPKIITGSYEEEVHSLINEIICTAPAQIIDIGASLGYYAVGFALKIAHTTVIAFEAVENPNWQQLAELARINGVGDKIVQRGFCTAEELEKVCRPQSFILCDCEGGEEDILNPQLIPALKSCTMLVELHEFYRPNVVGTLIDRFRGSHQIKIIEETHRNPSQYRILNRLQRSWRRVAVEETRYIQRHSSQIVTSMRFMLLTPKLST